MASKSSAFDRAPHAFEKQPNNLIAVVRVSWSVAKTRKFFVVEEDACVRVRGLRHNLKTINPESYQIPCLVLHENGPLCKHYGGFGLKSNKTSCPLVSYKAKLHPARSLHICRKIRGLGCVNQTSTRARVTQPRSHIFLHICCSRLS